MFGQDRGASAVIAACEALLEGRYVEELEEWGHPAHPIPPWAWMNMLAHGNHEALRRAARERPLRLRRAHMWHRARSYLAGEILDATTRAGSRRSLQSAVLVPLELELMLRGRTAPLAPGKWAARVLSAIDTYRRRPDRPIGDRG
jgi:hypothetical protein